VALVLRLFIGTFDTASVVQDHCRLTAETRFGTLDVRRLAAMPVK